MIHTYVLGADIGGTNSDFGIAEIKDGRAELILTRHLKTADIDSLVDPINELLEQAKKKGMVVRKACIAAAGVVYPDYCKLTNAPLEIRKK
jgi:glucokinase